MPTPLPHDPFELVVHAPFQPAGRRTATVFGSPVELLWLPDRAARPAIPTATSPAFRADVAERILANETVWRDGSLALTPNRYPFAATELLLWSEVPVREPDQHMLEVALQLEEATECTLVINSMGAAASIPRAHAHLVAERAPFLEQLPRRPCEVSFLPAGSGVELYQLTEPFPGLAVGVRGGAKPRARALRRLLELRTAPPFNVVSQFGTSWLFPRSHVEIPAPHFPHALGSAELWGRWCYGRQADFEAATEADLEAALRHGLQPIATPLQR